LPGSAHSAAADGTLHNGHAEATASGSVPVVHSFVKGLIYLPSAKPASRVAESASASHSDAPAGANPAVAYSLIDAPPAAECAWCGHRFDGADTRRPGRTRCSRCGVATTSPWPSDEQLGDAYAVWYRPTAGRFSGAGDAVLKRTRSALANGRDAVGVDPYSNGANPHVRAVEFEEMTGEWSAVIFWHSLEHLRRPVRSLRHAAELIVPGGMLIVAVPNATSMQARLFGDRWLALDLPRHLVHIDPPALLSQLEELGFRIERVSYLRGGQVLFGWLHGLVGRFPGHPDLYDTIRRSEARQAAQSPAFRLYALGAAVVALPVAAVGTAIEVARRAGGTIYVQARREQKAS